jgi:hypothetical protein
MILRIVDNAVTRLRLSGRQHELLHSTDLQAAEVSMTEDPVVLILPDLTHLELALVVSIIHLTEQKDLERVNFEMVSTLLCWLRLIVAAVLLHTYIHTYIHTYQQFEQFR